MNTHACMCVRRIVRMCVRMCARVCTHTNQQHSIQLCTHTYTRTHKHRIVLMTARNDLVMIYITDIYIYI